MSVDREKVDACLRIANILDIELRDLFLDAATDSAFTGASLDNVLSKPEVLETDRPTMQEVLSCYEALGNSEKARVLNALNIPRGVRALAEWRQFLATAQPA